MNKPSERQPSATRNAKACSAPLPPSPWDDLQPSGEGLIVHDFLTTLVTHAANGLRRNITVPYADAHGLSVSEWRMLSVLAHAGTLSFSELVVEAVADKAQVSRSLRLLQERGLVKLDEEEPGSRKKLQCRISRKGKALYETVMQVARASQARMILQLDPEERRALYHTLKKLMRLCGEQGGSR